MLVFYSLVTLMVMIALFIITRALLKNTGAPSTNPNQVALDIYQQRLSELQRDQAAGVLSDEQAGFASAELERIFLDEINAGINNAVSVVPEPKNTRDRLAAASVILLLPLLAGSLYYNLGQPDLISISNEQAGDGIHKDMPSVENMVETLAQRLQDNPDDTKGWFMLARSYMALGRYPDAVNAYEQLHGLVGDQPDLLVSYADAMAMANNRSLLGQPEELLQKALTLDPENVIGLWLAGRAADEKGQHESAIDYWQRLLPLLDQDPQSATEVRQLIKAAQEKLGIPESEQIVLAATQDDSPARQGNSITVNVELDVDLMEKTDQEDSLFIFAQALNGPPMPLAAVRKQVKDLPLQVTLDDSMAMIPTQKLSSHDMVKISARISKTGNALPQSGDLTATPVQTSVGQSEPVSLVINTRIP